MTGASVGSGTSQNFHFGVPKVSTTLKNRRLGVFRDKPKLSLRCSESFDTFYNRSFGMTAACVPVRTMGPDTMLQLSGGASDAAVRVSGSPILIL